MLKNDRRNLAVFTEIECSVYQKNTKRSLYLLETQEVKEMVVYG